jgi:phosphoglycolate phosphatase-like HAD superfamily hydrolase
MTPPAAAQAVLQRYATLFWDFDGVIKESLTVKSEAFERLFAPFGAQIAARVRDHHQRHDGMPRSEKLPLYLRWAGCADSAAEVARYSELFSIAVREAVVGCPWVQGASEYLQANCRRQRFVLVTATPQQEIEWILRALGATHWFSDVYGTPVSKAEAIAQVLKRLGCRGSEALLIGDSAADHEAAQAAGVDFLLRRTPFNDTLQRRYAGPQCEHFLDG